MTDNWLEDAQHELKAVRRIVWALQALGESLDHVGNSKLADDMFSWADVLEGARDTLNTAIGQALRDYSATAREGAIGMATTGILMALDGADRQSRARREGRAELAQEVIDIMNTHDGTDAQTIGSIIRLCRREVSDGA